MSTSYTYLKNSDTEVSASNSNTGEKLININSAIHPPSTTSKILVNKAKLSEGIMKESVQTLPAAEKIYYNPKFLTTHVKTLANIYNKQLNEDRNSSDTNIHINRNYLVSLNNTQTLKSSFLSGGDNNKQNRGAIHINPNFFKQNNFLKDDLAKTTVVNDIPKEIPDTCTNSSVIIKKTEIGNAIFNQPKTDMKFGIQAKSKYKYIKNSVNPIKNSPKKVDSGSKGVFFKTKYSLKRCNIGKENKKINEKLVDLRKLTKPLVSHGKVKLIRLSSEFKKLGRTKLVRKSVLQSMILARRRSRNRLHSRSPGEVYIIKKTPSKKRSKNLTFFPKGSSLINKTKYENLQNSLFKRLGKMKIVRKSLLKAQIEARNQVRKQRLRDSRIRKCSIKNYLSKSKLGNSGKREFIAKQRALLKWIKKKHPSESSSRIKIKKTSHGPPNPKKLKKNNQPCPFYNRFGRCKGKDKGTCPKLHDAKYISICRKLLQGECNAKDCLLSHDIRPGKMPTCHHYLAGVCTRPNCPFLHIKVNKKAPICIAFLQGFCPDVYNCLKRHEFICPKFAEKGVCPRGKSCTYPHRSPVIHSKLLKDYQKPLLLHRRRTKKLLDEENCESVFEKMEEEEVSNAVIKVQLECAGDSKDVVDDDTQATAEKIFLDDNRNPEKCNNKKQKKKDFIKEPFTRYFAIAETNDIKPNELHENNNDKQLEIKDEFR